MKYLKNTALIRNIFYIEVRKEKCMVSANDRIYTLLSGLVS